MGSITNKVELLESRRLMAAGDLDPTFGAGGVVDIAGDVTFATMTVMRSGGLIVVVDSPAPGDGVPHEVTVRRFNPDGAPDVNFGGGDGVVTISGLEGLPFVTDVEVDRFGTGLLLAGLTTPDNGNERFGVLALNFDGTVNTGFGGPLRSPGDASPGVATVEIEINGDEEEDPADFRDMAVSPDGRIALLGDANLDGYVALLTDRGDPFLPSATQQSMIKWGDGHDNFAVGIGSHRSYRGGAIAFGSDGRLIIGGSERQETYIEEPSAPTETPFVRVFELNGQGGWEHDIELPHLRSRLDDLVVLPDGGILAVTGDVSAPAILTKLTSDGETDPSFHTGGEVNPSPGALRHHIQPLRDGRFDVLTAQASAWHLKRFLADGTPDPVFGAMFLDAQPVTPLAEGLGFLGNDDPTVLTVEGPSSGSIKLRRFQGSGAHVTQNRTLLVGGTSGADDILVRRRPRDGRIVATINGEARSFHPNQVKRIEVHGYGEADIVTIEAETRPALVYGGDDDDRITGGDGNDLLLGGLGHDTITGGLGDDTLQGNGGNDYLLGSAGRDMLSGNGGRDTLSGAGGNDQLFGGPGSADRIIGGLGDDAAADDPLDSYSGVETLLS